MNDETLVERTSGVADALIFVNNGSVGLDWLASLKDRQKVKVIFPHLRYKSIRIVDTCLMTCCRKPDGASGQVDETQGTSCWPIDLIGKPLLFGESINRLTLS